MDTQDNKPNELVGIPLFEKETLEDSLGLYGVALDLINGEDTDQSPAPGLPSKIIH